MPGVLVSPTSPARGGDQDDYQDNRIGAAQKKMLLNSLLLDGLHTLAIQSFVSGLVLLGPSILAETSILLVIQLNQLCFDTPQTCGPAILIAVLLQSISGPLLLWTVGEAPTLYWSIYIAM